MSFLEALHREAESLATLASTTQPETLRQQGEALRDRVLRASNGCTSIPDHLAGDWQRAADLLNRAEALASQRHDAQARLAEVNSLLTAHTRTTEALTGVHQAREASQTARDDLQRLETLRDALRGDLDKLTAKRRESEQETAAAKLDALLTGAPAKHTRPAVSDAALNDAASLLDAIEPRITAASAFHASRLVALRTAECDYLAARVFVSVIRCVPGLCTCCSHERG